MTDSTDKPPVSFPIDGSEPNPDAAYAVMRFVNSIVGARDSGFLGVSILTISEVYAIARNYCRDAYGIEVATLEQEHDKETEELCSAPVTLLQGGKR